MPRLAALSPWLAAAHLLAVGCHEATTPHRGRMAADAPRSGASPAMHRAPGGGTTALTTSSGAASAPGAPPPDRAGWAQRASAPGAADASPPWPVSRPAPLDTEWCSDALPALDEETCYRLPARPTRELLLHLHGIVPPGRDSAVKRNLHEVLAQASERLGVAILLPRGRRGLAPRGHDGWWGWPTSDESTARLGPELLQRFPAVRERLEGHAGTPFERLYVAGSSSGAWFLVHSVARGLLVADGYAALSGGSAPHRFAPEGARRPFYVGYGAQDSVGPGARALAEKLRGAGFPVRLGAHPTGHGARAIYFDEAVQFFRTGAR